MCFVSSCLCCSAALFHSSALCNICPVDEKSTGQMANSDKLTATFGIVHRPCQTNKLKQIQANIEMSEASLKLSEQSAAALMLCLN